MKRKATAEWYRQGRTEELVEKPVEVLINALSSNAYLLGLLGYLVSQI
jgi:hypothetical protein